MCLPPGPQPGPTSPKRLILSPPARYNFHGQSFRLRIKGLRLFIWNNHAECKSITYKAACLSFISYPG